MSSQSIYWSVRCNDDLSVRITRIFVPPGVQLIFPLPTLITIDGRQIGQPTSCRSNANGCPALRTRRCAVLVYPECVAGVSYACCCSIYFPPARRFEFMSLHSYGETAPRRSVARCGAQRMERIHGRCCAASMQLPPLLALALAALLVAAAEVKAEGLCGEQLPHAVGGRACSNQRSLKHQPSSLDALQQLNRGQSSPC